MRRRQLFYLAGSWARRDRCRSIARLIERETGMGCTSRWLDSVRDDSKEEDRRAGAMECLRDLDASDLLVVLAGDSTSPGKHTEMGYMLAKGRPVHLVIAPWCTEEQADDIMNPCVFYTCCDSVTDLDTFLRTVHE